MYNVQWWLAMSEERLVAEIDGELKELVKSDPRTIKEIVESSLNREFQTSENAAIQRRLDEKKQRKATLQREINERQAELAEVTDEINRLKSLLERQEEKEDSRLSEAVDALSNKPPSVLQPDSQPVQYWADELAMAPENLIAKIKEESE